MSVNEAHPRRRWPSWFGLALALAVVISGIGLTLGAGQIGPGRTETGQGAYLAQTQLTYWTWDGTHTGTIPTPAPTRVSATIGAPTLLARAGRGYTLNAATPGHNAIDIEFEETGAPRSTEIELRFVIGLGGAATTLTAYVETRAGGVLGGLVFQFYWDAGAAVPTGLSIASAEATAVACHAIGACP